ncbi:MAG: DUF4037 domain-containing protein [Ktedonobacterales bacterium]
MQRLRLAQQMIAESPPTWLLDIALTGSASRGLADADSDIEFNAWGHDLPSPAERNTWLRTLGATEIALAVEVTDDGTTWDRWRYQDEWVEAGWQTMAALESCLWGTLRGELLDHARMMLAEVVSHAMLLRSHGLIASWQAALATYPDIVQQRLIDSTVERWSSPYTAITRWSVVRRGQFLAVTEELVGDIHGVLRVLFALNREWEPDWKWISALQARLPRKPDHLVERITACVSKDAPADRMRACTRLILDALALCPPTPAVAQARANLQAGLDAN